MKSYTDIEQSRKLAEILPIESADCYWEDDISVEFGHGWHPQHVPCWSLAALFGVLPEIQGCEPLISIYYNYITYPHIDNLITRGDNLIDACVEMIEKLHKIKLL